jgi:hypothetical protein
MPKVRKALADKTAATRSRVTNGKKFFLSDVDGRSALARRVRDVASAIAGDLGGADALTEAQMQLIRRATLIAVSCERMESDAAAGKDIDLELFGSLTDRLGRTLQRLGMKRVAKDITPSLDQYLRERA